MTINTDTTKLQHPKPVNMILAALLTVLLITGCASTPPLQEIDPAQETARSMFEEAREAYREFDYEKTTELLNILAAQGDANAQYALGYMYYYGFGVEHDEAIALEWIKKAAALGQADAIIALDRVKVSTNSERAVNEQNKRITDARTAAEASNGPDQHAQLVMKAESIIAEETAKPYAEESPEQTTSDSSSPDSDTQDTETHSEQNTGNSNEQTATITADTPAPSTETTQTPDQGVVGQDWVRQQNPDHYTIQVISGRNQQRMKQYMEKNGLNGQSTLYELQRTDEAPVYIGLYGVYSSLTEARQAVQSLPAEVQEAQPWIRSFKSIQAALR